MSERRTFTADEFKAALASIIEADEAGEGLRPDTRVLAALRIAGAAKRLSDCPSEFDGDLQYCEEYLNALWDACDGR